MTNEKNTSENACVIFGEFVKSTRLKNQIIARDAASNAGMLPSNFSKLEHGALSPPSAAERQKHLAQAIGLKLETADASEFFDLAGKATKSTPVDLAEIISRNEALPLLLRTLSNRRLKNEEIEKLVSLVRGTDEHFQNTQTYTVGTGSDCTAIPCETGHHEV